MLQVEEARGDPNFEWSVESVLHIISSTAGQVHWGERLRAFQDLRWDCAPAELQVIGSCVVGACPPAPVTACCTEYVSALHHIPRTRLGHHPCRFTYEEEQDAEAFFVPLVWSMIVADTALPWRHAAIVLFSPAPASEGGARTESTSSVFDPHELRSLQSLSIDDVSPVGRAVEEVQAV